MQRLEPGVATVAVLLTDVVGSTELWQRLRDVRAGELRKEHDRIISDVVGSHGGVVVAGTGDGVLSMFPTSSEAVACASAVQQAIAKRNIVVEDKVHVRIGISVGEVTIDDGDISGLPVIEATRICAAAEGGQILVSEIAARLSQARSLVLLEDVGERALKGLREPLRLFEVPWFLSDAPTTVPFPDQLRSDDPLPFVGRAVELANVRRVWRDAISSGALRIGFVSGEPGIGKTRLASELAAGVRDEGGVVLYGRCDELLATPLRPFVEALRPVLSGPLPSPELAGRFPGDLARLFPELRERLPNLPPPLEADPTVEQYRLLDAVATAIVAIGQTHPLLVILDDLHWADPQTLALLRHLVAEHAQRRLCVVGTFRPAEREGSASIRGLVADMRSSGAVIDAIRLSGVSDAAVAQLVASTPALADGGAQLAGALHRETDGNPFFVRELLRSIAARGDRSAGYDGGLAVDALPTSIREVIERRVDQLGADVVAVLRAACVVGEEVDIATLRDVVELDERRLVDALEQASDAGLLQVGGDPLVRVRFGHAIARATVFEALSATRRASLHGRVAQAIERRHGSDPGPHSEALAFHYAEAAPLGDAVPAVRHSALAAQYALAQLAYERAGEWYARALSLLDGAPAVPGVRRCDLLFGLGDAQSRAGDPRARATLLEAAAAAESEGDAALLARVALTGQRGFSQQMSPDDDRVRLIERALTAIGSSDEALRARLLAALASELVWAADGERRFALSDEALELARRSGDVDALGSVLVLRHTSIWAADTYAQRHDAAIELAELVRELDDPVLRFHAAHLGYGVFIEDGEVELADAAIADARRIEADLHQPTLSWILAIMESNRALVAGRLDDALEQATRSLELGRATRQPEALVFWAAIDLEVRRYRGTLAEVVDRLRDLTVGWFEHGGYSSTRFLFDGGLQEPAREQYDHAMRDLPAAIPRRLNGAGTVTNLAWLCSRLDDREHAGTLYRMLEPFADRYYHLIAPGPQTSHFLGLLATTRADWDTADRWFRQALAAHERLGASLFLAETELEWGRSLARRGDPARARQMLDEAAARADEHGAPGVARRAREVASAASAPERA
jgi:class 3 adenylate cyclase/tetratricopeptide (TPR) repeat protein